MAARVAVAVVAVVVLAWLAVMERDARLQARGVALAGSAQRATDYDARARRVPRGLVLNPDTTPEVGRALLYKAQRDQRRAVRDDRGGAARASPTTWPRGACCTRSRASRTRRRRGGRWTSAGGSIRWPPARRAESRRARSARRRGRSRAGSPRGAASPSRSTRAGTRRRAPRPARPPPRGPGAARRAPRGRRRRAATRARGARPARARRPSRLGSEWVSLTASAIVALLQPDDAEAARAEPGQRALGEGPRADPPVLVAVRADGREPLGARSGGQLGLRRALREAADHEGGRDHRDDDGASRGRAGARTPAAARHRVTGERSARRPGRRGRGAARGRRRRRARGRRPRARRPTAARPRRRRPRRPSRAPWRSPRAARATARRPRARRARAPRRRARRASTTGRRPRPAARRRPRPRRAARAAGSGRRPGARTGRARPRRARPRRSST